MATQPETEEPTTASKLKAKFQQQFEEAKQRLDQAKRDIEELRAEDKESIREKSAEIHQRVKAQQDRVKELRDQVADWLKDKKQETDEQVMSWRQKRELKHLQRRADRAEDYAVNAVVTAMMDVDEVEIAVLDALDARLDADAAAATMP